ncbi:MAG: CoA transferase, partial [Chloroflexota bacterium]|nr:CoA transferase [Chloroflexota bacterium]
MGGPMEGVQILEVAHWAAVPAATAILSDWGAEVVKIENPDGGDATRGVMGMGIYPFQLEVSPLFEVDNRNKRSVALRLGSEEAEAVLHRLIERADVFATNFEPPVLEKFNLQYDQLSEINPRLIYANLSGYGEEGADKDRPGYDWTTYWARSGIMAVLGEPDAPPVAARPAIGDHPASMLLAGAIAAALFSREKTGVGQKVGAALMHCGMWVLSTDIEASLLSGKPIPRISRKNTGNPLTISYLTKDEKWLLLTMPQADRYWPELCKAVGREDMEDDTRFNSLENRRDNSTELISILDEI